MQDIKDIAAQQATERTLKQPPPPQQETTEFTTAEELLARRKTGIARTTSGDTYQIQRISPGDFFLGTGSPLMKAISESGVDLTDKAEIEKVVEDLSSNLLTDTDFIELAKHFVIRGVTSIYFVDKRQDDCVKPEISIDNISTHDIIDIYTEIMNLSVSEEDVATMANFRHENEGESPEHNSDISDSPEVRETSNGDIVSGVDESEPAVGSG